MAVSADAGVTGLVVNQVTAGAAAATLLPERSLRKIAKVKNTDGTNAVFIGPATVTALNGYKLSAGQEHEISVSDLIQVIAPVGAPVICYWDEFEE